MKERNIDAGGVRTRYLDGGNGEPILFIHGGRAGDDLAESAEVWDLNLAPLMASFHCIALDRLGQGQTENPRADAGYLMSGSLAHVQDFIETLGVGALHLVGHGSGGYVVVQIALNRPDLVRSCTIISSSAAAPGWGREDIVASANLPPSGSPDRLRKHLESISFNSSHVTPKWFRQRQTLLDLEKSCAAQRKMRAGLHSAYASTLEKDRVALLARLGHHPIQRPTMLFWGYNDQVAPLSQAYALYDLIAKRELRCEMHIVNEAGHYCFRERPDDFNRILSNFIQDVRYGV